MKFFFSFLSIFSYIFLFEEASSAKVRIIGGDIAPEGLFKYPVSLQKIGIHFCGGAILDDEHILTAAHCVITSKGEFTKDPITAVMGTADLRNKKNTNTVIIKVTKIFVPKEYNHTEFGGWNGDIALLKLENPIGLATKPQLSKLELPENADSDYANKTVKITGFGWSEIRVLIRTEFGSSDKKLRYADVRTISHDECNKHYRYLITENLICGFVKQRNFMRPEGVCSGDSGSSLVLDGKTVIGVVSRTPIGCREDRRPGIYTRTTAYLPFLKEALKDRADNTMRVAIWEQNEDSSKKEFVEQEVKSVSLTDIL